MSSQSRSDSGTDLNLRGGGQCRYQKKMNHGKAVGPDNIPIEVFAVLEDIGIDFLT